MQFYSLLRLLLLLLLLCIAGGVSLQDFAGQSPPLVQYISGKEIRLNWTRLNFLSSPVHYTLYKQTASFSERSGLPGLHFPGLGYKHITSTSGNFVTGNFNLSFQFRTYFNNALLLYIGGHDEGDFVAVQLKNGHVVFSFHNGNPSGESSLEASVEDSSKAISDGNWHTVVIRKTDSKDGEIVVDGNPAVKVVFGGSYSSVTGAKELFLGGVPFNQKVEGNTTKKPFSGCLNNIVLMGVPLSQLKATNTTVTKNVMSRHVGCPVNLKKGIHFKGAGYLHLNAADLNLYTSGKPELKLKLSLRTLSRRGIVLAVQGTPWDRIMAVEVKNKKMVLTVIDNGGKSIAESTLEVCDATWHSMVATVNQSTLAIEVDGSLVSSVNHVGLLSPITAAYVGGIEVGVNISATFEMHGLSKISFPGCIGNLTINGNSADTEQITDSYSHVSLAGCPAVNGSESYCHDASGNTVYRGNKTETTDNSIGAFTEYLYQVSAEDNGTAFPSEWISVYSGTAVPNAKSLSLSSSLKDKQSNVTVSWTYPLQANGLLNRLEYQLLVYAYYPGSQLSAGDVPPSYNYSVVSTANDFEEFQYFLELSPFTEFAVKVSVVSPEGRDQSLPHFIKTSSLDVNECYHSSNYGVTYRGVLNQTMDGVACLSWSNRSSYRKEVAIAPNAGLGSHKYCRNPTPGNRTRPWCYTGSEDAWNYCQLNQCHGTVFGRCKDVPVVSFTCNGTGGNKECAFPFTFHGYLFSECTTYNSSVPWCATKVNATWHITEWGYCLCPLATTSAPPVISTRTTMAGTVFVISATAAASAISSTTSATITLTSYTTVSTALNNSTTKAGPTLSSQNATSSPWPTNSLVSGPGVFPSPVNATIYSSSRATTSQPLQTVSTSSLSFSDSPSMSTGVAGSSPDGKGQGTGSLSPMLPGIIGSACGAVLLALLFLLICRLKKRHVLSPVAKTETREMKSSAKERIDKFKQSPQLGGNDYATATDFDQKRTCEGPLEDTDGYLKSVSRPTSADSGSPLATYTYLSSCNLSSSRKKQKNNEFTIANPIFAEDVYETAYPVKSVQSKNETTLSNMPMYDEADSSVEADYGIIYDSNCHEEEIYWEPARTEEKLYGQMSGRKYPIIDKKSISTDEVIGNGEFGTVERGKMRKGSSSTLVVAVKTLKSSTKDSRVKFLREAAIMGQFRHHNVVKLLGVVLGGNPLMVVLDFMTNGDLKTYLLSLRPAGASSAIASNIGQRMLKIARNVANGLAYLHKKRFIHRDIAARNIMLDEAFTCKIGDFGLARDLADETYYVTHGGKIPVRWTAPEAIGFKKYTSASDVWSFGILLYEIWTLGERPYGFNTNSKIIQLVESGYRLPPPPGCSYPVYRMMVECWHPDHHKRVNCQQLVRRLAGTDDALLRNDLQNEKVRGKLGDPVDLESPHRAYEDLKLRLY